MRFVGWHLLVSLWFWTCVCAEPVPRTILGLYNSRDTPEIASDFNMTHLFAEMPLNFLGMRVNFHDIATGIPSDESLAGTMAILSYCESQDSENAETLCTWLTEQARKGKRLILLGDLPFLKDSITGAPTSSDLVDDLFQTIGLSFEGHETSDALVVRIDWQDSEMMGFEAPLKTGDLTGYVLVRATNPETRPYLKISRTDEENSESIAVATTPMGGYALAQTDTLEEAFSGSARWYLNPFLFFKRALGIEGMPAFDTTTLFGKRIYYSHIDGDGFRNLSEIVPDTVSGQVILDSIIKRYPLPVTASFITVEVNPEYLGNHDEHSLATIIYSQENVESGAHGFTHPLDWANGITVFTIPGYSVELSPEEAKAANQVGESGYLQSAKIIVPAKEWIYEETVGSCNYLTQNICPKDKPVVIFQVTGDCRAPDLALKFLEETNLLTINGGDARLDSAFPTYTNVAALTRTTTEGRRQVYASNANEDIYTNLWSGPFYAQMYVVETYQQTEIPTLIDGVPRRVLPMNLYYHYYSGEKQDSLHALHFVLDYIMKSPCIPIWTSHFCQIVEGFFSGEMEQLDGGGWRFSHYGQCQTVRFEEQELWPDLERSTGILGYVRWHQYLYVHLSEKGEATLYFAGAETKQPYLIEASAIVQNLQVSTEQIVFTTSALGSALYKFANMTPKLDYYVRQKMDSQDHRSPIEFSIRSGDDGVLEILAPVQGPMELEIRSMAPAS